MSSVTHSMPTYSGQSSRPQAPAVQQYTAEELIVSGVDEPSLYVNAKQFHRILKRRVARQKLEEQYRAQRRTDFHDNDIPAASTAETEAERVISSPGDDMDMRLPQVVVFSCPGLFANKALVRRRTRRTTDSILSS
jgi:hypothetical protein